MNAQIPKAGRPHMPGYGIKDDGDKLLPWSWAAEQLAKSRNYWLTTVRPDGKPHTVISHMTEEK
jgi:hypothetical protein